MIFNKEGNQTNLIKTMVLRTMSIRSDKSKNLQADYEFVPYQRKFLKMKIHYINSLKRTTIKIIVCLYKF